MTNGQLLKWMFQFVRPVKSLVAVCTVFLLLVVLAEILIAGQFGKIIDTIKLLPDAVQGLGSFSGFWGWWTSQEPAVARLRSANLWFTLYIVAICLLRYLREVSNMRFSMTMVFYIREAVYDKLQRVGFGFHDSVSTGQLITRALSDLQNVRGFIQTAIFTSLEIGFVVLGYTLYLFYYSPYIAVVALLPLPVWVWYILRFSKRVQPVGKAVMEAEDKSTGVLSENIQGVHVVKAFATEFQEIGKFGEKTNDFFGKVMTRIRMFADFLPVMRSIGTATHLMLYGLTGVLIVTGTLSTGAFLFVGIAVGSILGRLQQIDVVNQQYQAAIVSARRLYEVLMAEPTVKEKSDGKPLPSGLGTVRFENVTFGYDATKPVLKDVSFEVKGGSVVAIVGPTGAGKTTLISLLGRYYDPQQGRITIDGLDLRDALLSSIRTQIAPVFQETYLFSDTVAANIAYGRPGITTGEIEAAARLAQAHEFIEKLPKGYDTMLGERGSSLSGGQKQRLAIARAILFNPKILVLDDATAAIDPETEDLIRRGMQFVMADRTTFVIAHRISTVKRAKLVVVLEQGRVTEYGTHEELMQRDGHYRHIAEVQLYGDDEARYVDGEHPSAMRRATVEGKRQAKTAAPIAAQTDPGAEKTGTDGGVK